jgi:hypothetical protein
MSARTNASHPIVTLALAAAAILVLAGCAPYLPPGTRACDGFPTEVCQNQVADLDQEGMIHGGVAAYRLECTAGSCTAERGEGMLTVVFNDGTGRAGSFGYATPEGTPPGGPSATEAPLIVAPVCTGVPQSWCQDFARKAAADATRAGPEAVSITVRCTTTCTGTNGDVETRVTRSDGTVVTSIWGYRG